MRRLHFALALAAILCCLSCAHAQQCLPPNYCANTETTIKPRPTTPNFGTNLNSGLIWTDTSLPSVNPSPIVRLTDQASEPWLAGVPTVVANQSKSAGIGGKGSAKGLISRNNRIHHINTSGGSGHLILFDTATFVSGDPVTHTVITASKNNAGGGSATAPYDFGNGQFSKFDTGVAAGKSIWYAANGTNVPNLTVSKYVIDQFNGTFDVTAPFIDLHAGFPSTTTTAPTWLPTHTYATGDYVSAKIATPPNWSLATFVKGDLIQPTTGNPANCVFKVSTVGSRGSQPATWSAGSCTVGATLVEGSGTEAFTNLGNDGIFVFQLTSTGGNSGSGTPLWATASGHPDIASTVTDGSLTWTNSGVLLAVPQYSAFAGWSFDDTRHCSAFSNNSYGHAAASPGYDHENTGQGTSTYILCYDSATNNLILLNTLTGIQSQATCTGGGLGWACSGGSRNALTAMGSALTGITTHCTFEIHNAEAGSTVDHVVISVQNFVTGTCLENATGVNVLMDWKPFATYNATTSFQTYATISNHQGIAKDKLVVLGNNSINFGSTAGAYTIVLDANNPQATALTSWQVSPCDTSWFANDPLPPCAFGSAYDSHLAFWNDPLDDDLGLMIGTIYDGAGGHAEPVAPYQNEIVAVTVSPAWSNGSTIGAFKVYRFGHTFNTLTGLSFDAQFSISQVSYDGTELDVTTNLNCGFGDTSGNSTNLCGPIWQPSTLYALNDRINPYSTLTGSGTNYGVWDVTTPGTSAAGAWAGPQCTAGNVNATFTDAGLVTYTCKGVSNDKAEVLTFILSPAAIGAKAAKSLFAKREKDAITCTVTSARSSELCSQRRSHNHFNTARRWSGPLSGGYTECVIHSRCPMDHEPQELQLSEGFLSDIRRRRRVALLN
jgi:hypothetical protein